MSDDAPKRQYDNSRRRALAAQTRDRIVLAGAELVRGSSIRDWRSVTMRAVAARANVNERTVYRHFPNERALRDAVMQSLEEQVGIDLDALRLGDVAAAGARIFEFVSTWGRARGRANVPLDPTLVDANRRQHDALLSAVKEHAARWPSSDRTIAAATLDLLWAVGSYERLVHDWQLDHDDAVRAITWAIGLVEDAVRDGNRPPRAHRSSS